MPEDLPVVASLDDLKTLQAEIEALKAKVTALEQEALMPEDVKEAFAKFVEWVMANI